MLTYLPSDNFFLICGHGNPGLRSEKSAEWTEVHERSLLLLLLLLRIDYDSSNHPATKQSSCRQLVCLGGVVRGRGEGEGGPMSNRR